MQIGTRPALSPGGSQEAKRDSSISLPFSNLGGIPALRHEWIDRRRNRSRENLVPSLAPRSADDRTNSDEHTDAQAGRNPHFHPNSDLYPDANRNHDFHLHRHGDVDCKYVWPPAQCVWPPAILGREQLDPCAADGIAGNNNGGIDQRGAK
jgi:hypothetical protein